jgi:plasmid stability protein
MQKDWKKGLYLELGTDVMNQLRLVAGRHHRNVVEEATRILEEALRPEYVRNNAPKAATSTENYRANGIYLILSEELVARLRPLADRNYRSVAGQAAFVLQTILNLKQDESRITAASKPKPILKFRKKRGRPPKPK